MGPAFDCTNARPPAARSMGSVLYSIRTRQIPSRRRGPDGRPPRKRNASTHQMLTDSALDDGDPRTCHPLDLDSRARHDKGRRRERRCGTDRSSGEAGWLRVPHRPVHLPSFVLRPIRVLVDPPSPPVADSRAGEFPSRKCAPIRPSAPPKRAPVPSRRLRAAPLPRRSASSTTTMTGLTS
jgi:hypothetical protein